MTTAATIDSVGKGLAAPAGRLRFAHEILFCLNLALALKLEGNQKPNKFFSFFESGESLLAFRINTHLHLHPHHAFGADFAFLLLGLVLASLLFVLLQILLTSSFLKNLFRSTAGMISLIALPFAWVLASWVTIGPPVVNPPHWLLYLELATVASCGQLYFAGTWRLPQWLTITLLAVHFAFWSDVVSGGPYFWHDMFTLIFPLAGFLATLLWGIEVSRSWAAAPNRT